jgi:hypothetical protein
VSNQETAVAIDRILTLMGEEAVLDEQIDRAHSSPEATTHAAASSLKDRRIRATKQRRTAVRDLEQAHPKTGVFLFRARTFRLIGSPFYELDETESLTVTEEPT